MQRLRWPDPPKHLCGTFAWEGPPHLPQSGSYMSYNFQSRLAHNATRMKQINSELVTYTREGVTTITNLIASPIIQKTEDFGQYGFMLSTDNQQWGIDVDDLGS